MRLFFLLVVLLCCGCSSQQDKQFMAFSEPTLDDVVSVYAIDYGSRPRLQHKVQQFIRDAGLLLGVDVSDVPLPILVSISPDALQRVDAVSHLTANNYAYNFSRQVIIATDPLSARSYQDHEVMSLIYHEVVHHVQNFTVDIASLPCLQSLEIDAYRAQYNYMRLHGVRSSRSYSSVIEEHAQCDKVPFNPFYANQVLRRPYLEYQAKQALKKNSGNLT